jgi:eukaryotic-like serine/threonine-protein kinase
MDLDLAPGHVIGDKYRVERVLGEGGMGYVVAAHHLKLDHRVALKFLKPEALKHPHIVQRFAREARAAAKIRGEHVARVIDVGDLPNGAPFIVMEYLEGEDLAQRLVQRGPLQVDEAVGYLLQACEALAEAHAAGIIHRDLKPPNLFLARTAGRMTKLKVLDFGISKALDESSEGGRNLTSTTMIMGTPHYMSPEQLRSSRDVDQRADIWALGVVLFELLTGQTPFDGENATSVITSIVTEEPRPLLELRPDAPPELWLLVLRCLAKQRAERFPGVLDLARALAPFSGDRARDSLARIESIVKPAYSHAPPPSTEVSGSSLPSTASGLPTSEPGAVTSVDVSVPMVSTTAVNSGAVGVPSFGSQPTVRSAELEGPARVETRATWDATLPAAGAAEAKPRRWGGWLAAAAVTLAGVVSYAGWSPHADVTGVASVSGADSTPPALSLSPSVDVPPVASAPEAAGAPRVAASAVPAVVPSATPSATTPPPARSVFRATKSSPRLDSSAVAAPAPPAPPSATSGGGSLRMGIK